MIRGVREREKKEKMDGGKETTLGIY